MDHNQIAICVSNGPRNSKVLEIFLESFCSHLNDIVKNINVFIHCDGTNDINDYNNTDIIYLCEIINKKYNTKIQCTKTKTQTNHGGSLDDFMHEIIKKDEIYKWVIFLHTDVLFYNDDWINEILDLMGIDQYSLICKTLNPIVRTNDFISKTIYLQTTIYTAFFAMKVKDYFDLNGTFKGSYFGTYNRTLWNYHCQHNFKNNYIGFDTGSMLLFNFLMNGKTIYYYDFKKSSKLEHMYYRYKDINYLKEIFSKSNFFERLRNDTRSL